MQPAFAHDLADLYALADEAQAEAFPDAVLALVGRWVGFDGAVLGMGDACVQPAPDLEITQAHIHARDPRILDDYAAVSASDPVTQRFVAGLPRPLAVDCAALYARGDGRLDAFARAYGLRHLMLFGDLPRAGHAGRWLVLYRGDDQPFGEADAEHLHAAWLHVSRAIVQHRAALLARHEPEEAQRACALLGPRGRLEAVDRRFVALLRQEWPAFAGGRLPAALEEALEGGGSYRGQHVEVQAHPHGPFVVCIASAVRSLPRLTPGENAVARRFANGLSAKTIARELGVSPNTVRSQLAQLYAKLGVHDKAELAQHFR